jgi:hypothetical protein
MDIQGWGRVRTLSAIVLLAALAGCNSSKLQRVDASRDLADYRVVVVGDFPPRDAEAPKKGRATLSDATAAGQRFSLMLVEELRAYGVRGTVRRGGPEAGALLVSGEITGYDPGSAVLRGVVGFGLGGADFEVTVRLVDADSGDALGEVEVDKLSFPLAGALAAMHDVDILMRSAAESAAREIAIAQGVLKRGHVPAAKVRPQTGCGRGGPGCGPDD